LGGDVKRIAPIAALVFWSCSTETIDPFLTPVVLQTPDMTVTIGAPAFKIEVKNAKGAVVLSSDSALALGATHRAVTFKSHIIEGWDYQISTDAPPNVLSHVNKISSTPTTASIDVDDQ
jgi:hypothetical protein